MPRPLNGNSVTMEEPYWAFRLSSAALKVCMLVAVARCFKGPIAYRAVLKTATVREEQIGGVHDHDLFACGRA